MNDTPTGSTWPALPLSEWQDSRDTLLLWTQIVGKVRLADTPLVNHWWNVPLYVTARGLTTSLVPHGARAFSVDFDLVDHRLVVSVTDGSVAEMALVSRTVAEFYGAFTDLLAGLGLETEIWTMPVELPDAIAFESDDQHSAYDPVQVHRWWLAQVQIWRGFELFRAEFVGKCSPVHLFWGALDLAVTRFSGRSAPLHPGGAPNCGPHVMHEAYSHEVSSAGYWPGGDDEGVFYSYAYPEPEGYRTTPVGPSSAAFDTGLGEFVLPYRTVRESADPDATLLEFLRTTYAAAADRADWDRGALERRP